LLVGSTSFITATARDAQGNALSGRTTSWSSTAPDVASVSQAGQVSANAPGVAQVRATIEGKTGEVAITVRAIPWTVTGSLAIGRTLHTATLLANGKVLVSGGQTLGAPFEIETFSSAELYDPAAGTWRTTGRLATGRENHISVRLQDGKVLVAGGYSIELREQLSSAELYDPDTETWSATGSMTTARDLPTAVLLPDGKVLVAGGLGRGTSPASSNSAEIYDPGTGTWSAAGTMTVERGGHTATLLGNGKVLVAGGTTGSFMNPVVHASSELYEPATGAWSASGSFATARAFHKAVTLASGRALIVGGGNVVSTSYGATDLHDNATGLWTGTGSLATPRSSHTATLLPNGRVLVAGGLGVAGTLASVEIYDPATGTWSAGVNLRVGRLNHAAVLLADGRVLVVGGQGSGAATSTEIFDPTVAFAISAGR
jgi:N-acetylneuraminic acid mutarotase